MSVDPAVDALSRWVRPPLKKQQVEDCLTLGGLVDEELVKDADRFEAISE